MTRSPHPDISVNRAVMKMTWDNLAFLHYRYDPTIIQAMLPAHLTVQTFDDAAWVSLVPFVMRITAPGVPYLPWIGRFCETNVRTYVTGADGTEGIWFFSLDAARLAAVVFARASFGLPYIWSSMTYEARKDEHRYTCRRMLSRAESTVAVRAGAPYQAHELTELDHFLSARWRLYTHHLGATRFALAEHEPWPLQRAELLDIDDHLITADGLPAPRGDPIVQYSPRVSVRVSGPRRVRPA